VSGYGISQALSVSFSTFTGLSALVLQGIMNSTDRSAWLIHFVDGDSRDLELRKLPVLVNDVKV